MNQDQQGPPAGAVVVGVALDGSQAALRFAADQACRTHSPLHLVHVFHLSSADAYAGLLPAMREAADQAFAQAMEHARHLAEGQVPVTGERVLGGRVVATLVDRASRGSMLVLEHRRLSPVRRLVTGSTVAGVASRCDVPVASVPEGWTGGTTEGVVIVGVQNAEESPSLIGRGMLEARAREASVMVLHAWHIGGGYDPVVADADFRAEQDRRFNRQLAPALDAARADFPGDPLRLKIQHEDPGSALLARADRARLLVIGARHHLLPFGSHVGPVARAVLQHATVPVVLQPVVPLGAAATSDDAARASRVVQLA
jgi:nucleotide-binding universal stress UspA family protein